MRSVETEVEVDTAMAVAVALVEAVAVGGHGRSHGPRDSQKVRYWPWSKSIVYTSEFGTGESFLKSFLCIVLHSHLFNLLLPSSSTFLFTRPPV